MKIPLVLLVLALFLLPLSMSAQGPGAGWTAVASTGAIDEASLTAYETNGSFLQHLAGSVVPVVARYNVTNSLAAFTNTPPWDNLELGYFDNAAGSAVSATLYRVDPCTGNRLALCTVTSIDNALATCRRCTFTQDMDFGNYLFYVEVTVTRNASALTPSARTLRIFD